MIKPKRNKRLTRIYSMMKQRCYNKNVPNFKWYGGRGISVCDEWINDAKSFYDWAISNGYKDDLTIDRIDNNGNYCPENCRWVTVKEQDNHRTNNVILTLEKESHTIAEWSNILHIKHYVIRNRIRRGWTIKDALTRKVGVYEHKN